MTFFDFSPRVGALGVWADVDDQAEALALVDHHWSQGNSAIAAAVPSWMDWPQLTIENGRAPVTFAPPADNDSDDSNMSDQIEIEKDPTFLEQFRAHREDRQRRRSTKAGPQAAIVTIISDR